MLQLVDNPFNVPPEVEAFAALGQPETPAVFPVLLSCWIPVYPRPKGSLKVVSRRGKRPVLQEDNPHSATCRATMVTELGMRTEFGRRVGFPVHGPVEVELTFVFQRPAGSDAEFPTREVGDLDKLTRNVLDALQDAKVFVNDAQVVRVIAEKGWVAVEDGDEPGVMITVREAL